MQGAARRLSLAAEAVLWTREQEPSPILAGLSGDCEMLD
jgi:hypothetical protein